VLRKNRIIKQQQGAIGGSKIFVPSTQVIGWWIFSICGVVIKVCCIDDILDVGDDWRRKLLAAQTFPIESIKPSKIFDLDIF